MITLERTDNMSILLQFNESGLDELIESFKAAVNGDSSTLEARVDKSVTTMKRSSPTGFMALVIKKGDKTTMTVESGSIVWSLDDDDLESALDRFVDCQSRRAFSPPEFIRVQVPKNKRLDYVYCELTDPETTE